MLATGEAIVDARELVYLIIDLRLLDSAPFQIEREAIRLRLATGAVAGHVEARHPAKIHHDRIAIFISIEEMKNVKRVGREPLHLEALAIHHADARALIG